MKARLAILICLFTLSIFSCNKLYDNPYDRECPPEVWTPDSLSVAINGDYIEITWKLEEIHFDGFVLEKSQDNATWFAVKSTLIDKTDRSYLDIPNYSWSKIYYRIYAIADRNTSDTTYSVVFDLSALSTLCTISTNVISSILPNSAISGGNISFDGRSLVTHRGICWSRTENPTVAGEKTNDGSGKGSFSSIMNGLSPSTTYFVRAYATNSTGTSYGDQRSFTTSPFPSNPQWSIFNPNLNYGSVSDIEGNTYKTIQIGTQTWMAENLKTLKYNDGTPISLINQQTVEGDPGYLVYGDVDIYGFLYNWYAVSSTTNGGKNVCPTGWHVPTDEEWILMEDFLSKNGYNYDGTIGGANLNAELWRNKVAKALSSATLLWIQSVYEGAIGNEDYPEKRNASGFSALPGGLGLSVTGFTGSLNVFGHFWTSTSALTTLSWSRTFIYAESFNRRTAENKSWQFSIRCIKD